MIASLHPGIKKNFATNNLRHYVVTVQNILYCVSGFSLSSESNDTKGPVLMSPGPVEEQGGATMQEIYPF